MKRIIAILLITASLFGFSACGKAEENPAAAPSASPAGETAQPAEETAQPLVIGTPRPSAETEPGLVVTELPLPEGIADIGGFANVGDTLWHYTEKADGSFALVCYDTVNELWQTYPLELSIAYPRLRHFSAAGSSVWLLVSEDFSPEEKAARNFGRLRRDYVVHMNFSTGEFNCTEFKLSGSVGSESSNPDFANLIAVDDNWALLCGYDSPPYIIDLYGQSLGKADFSTYGTALYARIGSDLYISVRDGYKPLNPVTMQLGENMGLEDLLLYSSAAGNILYGEGRTVFELNAAGSTSRFEWMDIALSYGEMGGGLGFENSVGDFFYSTGKSLVRVSEGMVAVKKPLVLACFGSAEGFNYRGMNVSCSNSLMDAVIRFNNTDPEYKIEIRPVIYETEADRDRLLIELISGGGIDLVDTSILPVNAVKDGVFLDLLPYIDADPAVSREDFIQPLLKAMMKDGGMYEYTDKFALLTLLAAGGAYENTADWTAAGIETLMQTAPYENIWAARDLLLPQFVWAATAEFIDRDNYSSSFDSAAFMGWLGLLAKAQPKAEDAPLLCVTASANRDIKSSNRILFKDDYVVAGFPDSSGSGSYFIDADAEFKLHGSVHKGFKTSLGIMASTENRDGAWRFMRTLMLGEESINLASGIPALRESFERAVETWLSQAAADNPSDPYFSASDAEKLREAVYSAEKMVYMDEALLGIIRSECEAFLGGDRSAEETARQIQSRVSIYLAEQR